MNVTVNGEPRTLPARASVREALEALQLAVETRGVAVALDGEVVRRGEWETVQLRDGARLEVLGAIGGGR